MRKPVQPSLSGAEPAAGHHGQCLHLAKFPQDTARFKSCLYDSMGPVKPERQGRAVLSRGPHSGKRDSPPRPKSGRRRLTALPRFRRTAPPPALPCFPRRLESPKTGGLCRVGAVRRFRAAGSTLQIRNAQKSSAKSPQPAGPSRNLRPHRPSGL